MAGTMLSVILLVAGVVLMLVLHVLIVVWALRRGVALRGVSWIEERVEGLTADELRELPCHERKSGGGECAVCLEAFQAGDRCRALPRCEHGFHAQCVDSWLRKSRVCPICRAEVVGRGKLAGAVVDEAAASENADERLGGYLTGSSHMVAIMETFHPS